MALKCWPKKYVCQKFAQFKLWRAPDSVNNNFSNWDKSTLVVIINGYKIMWEIY